MRVKNTSGTTRQFVFGGSESGSAPVSLYLANNAEGTIPDRADVVTSAVQHSRAGLLDIITPPSSVTFNEGVNKIVSVTLTNASDSETVTVSGVAFTTLPLSSTALEAATDLSAKINANPVLRAAGVFARDAFVSGANAVTLIELPASIAVGAVTSGDGTNAAVATVQAAAVAPEALLTSVRKVVAAGTGLVVATGLRNITALTVCVTRAGVLTYVTSTVNTDGGLVTFAANGAVNLAAADVVTVVAYGTL